MLARELARALVIVAAIVVCAGTIIALLVIAAHVLQWGMAWFQTHPISERVAGGAIAAAIVLAILWGQSKERTL